MRAQINMTWQKDPEPTICVGGGDLGDIDPALAELVWCVMQSADYPWPRGSQRVCFFRPLRGLGSMNRTANPRLASGATV
jgi:hypothetical protein